MSNYRVYVPLANGMIVSYELVRDEPPKTLKGPDGLSKRPL